MKPEGVPLAESVGGACFLLSQLELAADVGGAVARRVEVDDERGIHDEDHLEKN